jgi:hypothetical protein
MESLQGHPVPTTGVLYASDQVQQVVELVGLGLFIRRLGITMVNPFSQVEQPASREEPINR